MFTPMATVLKPGEKGDAKLSFFEITEKEAELTLLRQMVTRGRQEAVMPGTYARLHVNGELVMSDTQMEQRTNRTLVYKAKGDVLIAGLGLGMVLLPILQKKEVETVVVVEKSQDVIDLIRPQLGYEDKLFVFQGNIDTWKPEPSWRFDTIYFDIWSDISTGNLKQMSMLHKRFCRRLNKGGWMGSWMRDELKSGRYY